MTSSSQSKLRKPGGTILSGTQRQIIGGIIFSIGVLIGLGFTGLTAITNLNGVGFWGDSQDARDFNHDQPTQAELIDIRCPILLAPGEEGTITAVFRNTHQEKANISVKAVISENGFDNYRIVTGNLPIEPGVEQDFNWQVSRQDVVEGNFILSRVFLINQYNPPVPARTDACGIFVLRLFGLKGNLIVALLLVTGLLCLAVGSFLLYHSNSRLQKTSPPIDYGLYGLAGILGIGMVTTLFGWWIFAGLILLLAVLFTVTLILALFNLI